MRPSFPAAVSTRQMPWVCDMGDLVKEIKYRYGPPMPCGPHLGAPMVLGYGMVRTIEECPFAVRGLSSQTVHLGAQRGVQAAARWQRILVECR